MEWWETQENVSNALETKKVFQGGTYDQCVCKSNNAHRSSKVRTAN